MSDALPGHDAWLAARRELESRVPAGDFHSLFGNVRALGLDGRTFTLAFTNDFALRRARAHYARVVEDVLSAAVGSTVEVELVLHDSGMAKPDSAGDSITEDQLREEFGRPTVTAPASRPQTPAEPPTDVHMNLNDRYRFDTFVIGDGNQFAHAAALSVAEAPGQSYNPLFIYGATGLGKTHLLHAIGHYVKGTRPEMKVGYVTAERFATRFLRALQQRDLAYRDRFKEYFRGIDVLLVDDVQFLGATERLQEEFFYTFNALHEAGRQVVLTSDCEPGRIARLEDRLRSRFAWGLITDIATPDRETRVTILRKKAQSDGMSVPMEVLSLIGERVTTNVRELEGALTRVVGYASLSGRPMTVDLCNQVLNSYLIQRQGDPITIDTIKQTVCQHFRMTHDDLVGPRKSNDVARPRMIAMYLARVLINAPSTQIGHKFGGRDHSTVLSAERRIDKLIKEDQETFDLVEQLTHTLKQGANTVTGVR